jgi:hypothetical protein
MKHKGNGILSQNRQLRYQVDILHIGKNELKEMKCIKELPDCKWKHVSVEV